ncbi:MAG: fructose-6-phosphate aldolase [bacterium]
MKIFLDTANVNHIREVAALGLLDGVTTNPTLVAREKREFKDLILEICRIVPGPVSAEVVSTDADGIVREARILAKWANNIVVKVPITPDGLKAVRTLSAEGIKTNVTLVFSLNQAFLACRAGAAFVSPFVGRLDDAGHDGIELVADSVDLIERYGFAAEVISASIRGPLHVIRSLQAGAHVATLPYDTLMKLFNHPLTDKGIKAFLDDWKKADLKFPDK